MSVLRYYPVDELVNDSFLGRHEVVAVGSLETFSRSLPGVLGADLVQARSGIDDLALPAICRAGEPTRDDSDLDNDVSPQADAVAPPGRDYSLRHRPRSRSRRQRSRPRPTGASDR
jgi:hypothetical protein